MTPETCNSPDTEAQAVNVALLPCPHCGSDNLRVFDNTVSCMGCDANGPDLGHCVGAACRTEAVAAWNRRAAPALPQDVAGIVRDLHERAEWRAKNEGPFTKENLVEHRAASLILSQSAALASAREVIEQVAEGSIDASATAIIIGWPTARTVLDAAREWKGR